VVGSVQALWVGKFFVFEKLSFEDLDVAPCSEVSEDGHNGVARTQLLRQFDCAWQEEPSSIANLIAPGKKNLAPSPI
jgi:hypothetical protein